MISDLPWETKGFWFSSQSLAASYVQRWAPGYCLNACEANEKRVKIVERNYEIASPSRAVLWIFVKKTLIEKKGLFCNDCLWFVTSSKINKNWQQIAMVWERNLEKIETSRHQKHTHIHAHTLANTYVKCKFSHQPNTVCGFIYLFFWDFVTLFHY